MVMLNHELVESGAYPYGFLMEVRILREVADDRGSDTSVSSSSEVLALGDNLDPSINLVGDAVMEDLMSYLMGLSLSADPNPPVRFSPIIHSVGAVKTLKVISTGSNGLRMDRRSKGVVPALRSLVGEGERCDSNSALSVASSLATQQQFRSEDLYQSNWYRESASETISNHLHGFSSR
ncbi:hypothetical protein AYI68_g6922 [Smittium mucronatum]|uniref:Uncharacterized protein n=1 Tax=Smittium mucronatum TaxID=133383 RepID=A0A1R0GQ64_9FUNG|nr:hypothetical protein AYI68_g6922 [Smittium mucronatum]